MWSYQRSAECDGAFSDECERANRGHLPRLHGTRETVHPPRTGRDLSLGLRPLSFYFPEQFGEFRFQSLESGLLPLAPQAVDAALQYERTARIHSGHFAGIVEYDGGIRPSKGSTSPLQLRQVRKGPSPSAVNHIIFDGDGCLFHRVHSQSFPTAARES